MQKPLLFAISLLFTLTAGAQLLPKDELKANPSLSASNYAAYQGPKKALTRAPKGKKPFYISHYGRHGSRYQINQKEYTYPLNMLQMGDARGKLTPLGKDVLRRVAMLEAESRDRLGELTPLGAQQHKDIARRMYERFPEVFAGNACIEAKSTVVIRCILSMENALQELLLHNPKLQISHDASYHDMYYMNHQDRELTHAASPPHTRSLLSDYCSRHRRWKRLVYSLFNDSAYVQSSAVNGEQLTNYLFKLANNVQNTEIRHKMTLDDLFTDEERLENWRMENAFWFLGYSHTPLNGGTQPFIQSELLHKIIEQADSCIRLPHPGATLRFGHETIVLPLAVLMGINGYDMRLTDLEQLEEKGWVNYRVFPMAANIQLVYYRSSPADNDVLVKVLLNEDEATLPVATDCAPYYHWRDVREFLLKKLASYGGPTTPWP